MRSAALVLFALHLCACTRNEAPPDGVQLVGEVFAEGEYLGRPESLAVVGDRLFVTDASPPFLHVISLKDGVRQLSFGQEGGGPGEFHSATEVLPDSGGESFWVFDSAQRRIAHFTIPEGAAAAPQVTSTLNLVPGGPTYLMQAEWLNDSTLAAVGIYPDGRIAVTDRRGRIVRYIGQRPDNPLGEPVPITVLQHAFTGPLTVAPNRRYLAMGTENADRLEIYLPNGTLVRAVRGASGFDPVFEAARKAAGNSMVTGSDLRFGYTGLVSTDRHIYALYSGQTRGEGGAYSYFGTQVHVYTWSGDRVGTFKLGGLARGIGVTPDGGQLYAAEWAPKPRIVRYPLEERL